MVVEMANSLNRHMHNGDKPVVGVIAAPDALPNRVLYTNTNANRVYNDLQYEIYQDEKHASPPKKSALPPVLVLVLGLAGIGTAIVFRKKIYAFCKGAFSKLINLFKKSPKPPSP